jgi:YfiH family protein
VAPTPRLIPFTFPGLDRVGCAFGARAAGARTPLDGGNISLDVDDLPRAVRAARRAMRAALGFESWEEVRQVHGTQMLFDPEPGDIDAPGAIEADGLATAEPGRALVIKTADCQPVLLAHESGSVVAALHVGWRGNVADFPGLGVRALCREYGLAPAELLAVRGPSLGPSAAQFTRFDAEFGPDFAPYHDPATRTVDLWRLTHDQLLAAGLRPERIHGLDLCTRSFPELFFSYRHDRDCGRQASVIWIRK